MECLHLIDICVPISFNGAVAEKFMTNISRDGNSKIAVQKLDLPKGGGAIEGIGEKFEANGFTGTSALSLPIYASPCRDFAPSLSLSYSSGSGNGCFGMGWSPSLAKISRKTSKGLPRYNASDTFLYGGEDLVPIQEGTRIAPLNSILYTIQKYYVRTESSFDLIEYWQAPEGTTGSQSFWKITHANHMISIFGKREQAVISDPSSPDKIFEWLLEENYNPTGDHQLFFYKEENSDNVPKNTVSEENRVVTANKYIQFVRYGYKDPVAGSMILTNHPGIKDANKGDWHFEIVFDYGEYDIDAVIVGTNLTPYKPTKAWAYRPDPFSMYRATFEVRTMRRCFHTLCFHRFLDEFGTTEPVLVKASAYSYGSDAKTKLSHLTSIEEIGFYYDTSSSTYTNKALPPLDLKYQSFDPTGHGFTEIEQEGDRPLPGMEQAPYNFVDLYGEGIAGILYVADRAAYYQEPILTPKNGSTEPPRLNSTDLTVPAATATLSYAAPKRLTSFPLVPGIQSGEMALRNITGDGQLDLVIASDAIKGFYETHGVKGWQDYQEFTAFPSDYHQAYQEFGDLTGKGLADLMLLNGNEVRVYPSRKGEGFGNALFATHSDTATATLPPRLERAEQEFTNLMDISGNGTPDIVRVQQNKITYWPSLGYGKFDKPITMGNCPDLGADFNTKRLFFADLDGSGSKDMLYFYLDHVKIYFNQSGNAWSAPIEIPFPADILQFSDLDQISFADLFARGTTCLVLSKEHAFPAPKRWYYDFGQQQKPYLLQKIINNLGAETEISYRSSVDYYLQDKQAGLPWITSLPFPVQVVAEVTHRDLISKTTLVQHHAYHHGYYDGEEQEFRGFGRVDMQDTETIDDFSTDSAYHSPPSFSKTWYHTSAYEQEQDLLEEYKKEYWQGDRKTYPMPGTDFQMLPGTPDPKTVRLAHVALFGTVMRHEVYGKDGTSWQETPYSVSQTRMRVKELQAVGHNLYGIFFTHTLESISYDYERNADDPHCAHNFVLEVDDYGAVTKSCVIAYARREVPADQTIPNPDTATQGEEPNLYLYENVPQTAQQQQEIRFTYATQTYVDQTDPDRFLLSVPTESRSYEVPKIKPAGDYFTFKELYNEQTQSASFPVLEKNLIAWSQNYYFDPVKKEELDWGNVTLPLLHCRTRFVEFLADDVPDDLTVELDQQNESGYIKDTDNHCYWNPGAFQGYFSEEAFYLPQYHYDPFHYDGWQSNDPIKTVYKYDKYNLMTVQVTDALQNQVNVEKIDYQHLHPVIIRDNNNNISEVLLDPLGFVIVTSHYGDEGDQKIGFDELTTYQVRVNPTVADIINNPAVYLQNAATFFYYDLMAWKKDNKPVYSLHLSAKEYVHQRVTPARSPEYQYAIAYNDGFGRVLQAKSLVNQPDTEVSVWDADKKQVEQVTANTAWLTTGATRYNNKGQPIKQYEPFFTDTYLYIDSDALNQAGVSSTLYYDALGREVVTISPKGYLTKSLFGYFTSDKPSVQTGFLNQYLYAELPGAFIPSPWNDLHFDANDAVLVSPYYENKSTKAKDKEKKKLAYAVNTPLLAYHDSLGRTVQTEQIKVINKERNSTYIEKDIRGNNLTEADRRLFVQNPKVYNFHHTFSLANEAIKTISVDAGTHWGLSNAVGNPFYGKDSRGFVHRTTYDVIHRPVETSVSGRAEFLPEGTTITTKSLYGNVLGKTDSELTALKKWNLLGKPIAVLDQSGFSTSPFYSIAGVPLASLKILTENYKDRPNWDSSDFGSVIATVEAGTLRPSEIEQINTSSIQGLESERFTSFTDHNAVGETIQTTDPDGNITRPTYYLNGWGKALEVKYKEQDTEATAVSFSQMKYNARGQSVFVRSGNGTTTNHTYEPTTFRLVGIKTIRVDDNKVLQDLTYTYDPVGNVTGRTRNHIDTVFFNGQAVDGNSEYTHDSLYRLVKATGREHIGTFQKYQQDMFKRSALEYQPVNVQPLSNSTALQRYSETYQYDAGGNLTQKRHHGYKSGSTFIRSFGIDDPDGTPRSNRLKMSGLKNTTPSSTDDSITYTQDANGNQTKLEGLQGITWNERNNLDSVVLIDRSSAGKPNDQEYYQYDAGGQRTRKVFERLHDGDQQWIDEVIYLGSYEIRRRKNRTHAGKVTTVEDYRVVRVQSNGGAVIWRYQAGEKASSSPAISQKRYQLQDHLNSSTLEVDQDGKLITYEEYYPYGGTSIIAAQSQTEIKAKYYRYSFKERDNTTGLYYYGMRYYCTWLGRWMSPDPAGTVDGLNLYAFVGGNPVTLVDIGGMAPKNANNKRKAPSEREEDADDESENNSSSNQFKNRLDRGRKQIMTFIHAKKLKIKKGQKNVINTLMEASQISKPRNFANKKEQELRWVSSLFYHLLRKSDIDPQEVQAALTTNKEIVVAGNTNKANEYLKDIKVPISELLTTVDTRTVPRDRERRHIIKLNTYRKALGEAYNKPIETVDIVDDSEEGLHAERRIKNQFPNLEDGIFGRKRPCLTCAVKLGHIGSVGPHWSTEASNIGLSKDERRAMLSNETIKTLPLTSVTRTRSGSLTWEHGTDSESTDNSKNKPAQKKRKS